MSLFGAFFPAHSYPITDASFTRTDETHWVLDVGASVRPDFTSLKEVALFLVAPNLLPPDAALGLYVSVGGADWSYRGYVSASHPSEVLPLQWPDAATVGTVGGSASKAIIGVSMEPLAQVSDKEGSKTGAREAFAKAVAMDLYRYMESFGQGTGAGTLVVPTNVLEQWYARLANKLRRDPQWLSNANKT